MIRKLIIVALIVVFNILWINTHGYANVKQVKSALTTLHSIN